MEVEEEEEEEGRRRKSRRRRRRRRKRRRRIFNVGQVFNNPRAMACPAAAQGWSPAAPRSRPPPPGCSATS